MIERSANQSVSRLESKADFNLIHNLVTSLADEMMCDKDPGCLLAMQSTKRLDLGLDQIQINQKTWVWTKFKLCNRFLSGGVGTFLRRNYKKGQKILVEMDGRIQMDDFLCKIIIMANF